MGREVGWRKWRRKYRDWEGVWGTGRRIREVLSVVLALVGVLGAKKLGLVLHCLLAYVMLSSSCYSWQWMFGCLERNLEHGVSSAKAFVQSNTALAHDRGPSMMSKSFTSSPPFPTLPPSSHAFQFASQRSPFKTATHPHQLPRHHQFQRVNSHYLPAVSPERSNRPRLATSVSPLTSASTILIESE